MTATPSPPARCRPAAGLRPDPEAAGRFAEPIARHLQAHGRHLDHRTREECYSPVHCDAATHHWCAVPPGQGALDGR